MSRKILYAGAAAAILSAVALPALASTETIGLNQWYTASFGESFPSPVVAGVFANGTHPTSIATTAGSTDWSITLSGPEPLTVVDLEAAGDQFQVLDNGVVLGNTDSHNRRQRRLVHFLRDRRPEFQPRRVLSLRRRQ